jgi:hypothetical protein
LRAVTVDAVNEEAPMCETPVVFRKYGDGEIIAIFPSLPGGRFGECQSYLHIGQHGSADYGHVIRTTSPAGLNEYADLRAELVQVGYDDLRVYRREMPRMPRERLDGYREIVNQSARPRGVQQ